ncbi:MAG: hypothetical protein GKC02_10440 [Methanomassiliicoccales archaeon]|nr:hypothetical protein [Methanomassiliicoccales archaeon]
MSKTLRTCNLCNQVEGEFVHGRRIVIEEHGVCSICREELKRLEKIYVDDYELRTGSTVEMVVPWPAFKGFSWPPYSDVIISGWEYHKHEFGLGITDDFLLAGRRSIQSYEKYAFDRIQEIQNSMEATDDYKEKIALRRELQKWQKNLDVVEKRMRMGERRLPMISLDHVYEMVAEFSEDWVRVSLKFRRIKTTFFNRKKEISSSEFFKFSRIYEEAFDCMADKVKRKGGKVTITGR